VTNTDRFSIQHPTQYKRTMSRVLGPIHTAITVSVNSTVERTVRRNSIINNRPTLSSARHRKHDCLYLQSTFNRDGLSVVKSRKVTEDGWLCSCYVWGYSRGE